MKVPTCALDIRIAIHKWSMVVSTIAAGHFNIPPKREVVHIDEIPLSVMAALYMEAQKGKK